MLVIVSSALIKKAAAAIRVSLCAASLRSIQTEACSFEAELEVA